MTARIVAHEHDCDCKGCRAARRREARGEQERTPQWSPLPTQPDQPDPETGGGPDAQH